MVTPPWRSANFVRVASTRSNEPIEHPIRRARRGSLQMAERLSHFPPDRRRLNSDRADGPLNLGDWSQIRPRVVDVYRRVIHWELLTGNSRPESGARNHDSLQ